MELLNLVEKRVYIMSPFISKKTADYLANWVEEASPEIKCKIITRFNRLDFIKGANRLEGLERLLMLALNYMPYNTYIPGFIFLIISI